MSSMPMTESTGTLAVGATNHNESTAQASVLVCLPSISLEGLHRLTSELVVSFSEAEFVIASCNEPQAVGADFPRVRIVPYPIEPTHSGWVLTASDYLTAANLASQHKPTATLLLGTDAVTLSRPALRALCSAVIEGGGDLVLPRYQLGPHEGLVSAAILHPLSRALYGIDAYMPLPLDVGFSARMASKLSVVAKRPANLPGGEALLWPASEAAVASFTVHEIEAGNRTLPQPNLSDLNTLLAQITGSLFADAEAKASFWQRARNTPATAPSSSPSLSLTEKADIDDVRQIAADFRNAYNNLQEIWSIVLPPQSLLALKKLAGSKPEAFLMPANLWARIIYDFVLAFRLRPINRSHLLGALTPLYLAWVGSHLRMSDDDQSRAEQHIDETSAAFVAEKPYLVSRWRWPDRFNP